MLAIQLTLHSIHLHNHFIILKQGYILPKSPHNDHNTVDKNSTEESIEQCQHPGEDTHIHVVEQARPRGMKKTADKTTKYVTTTKTEGKLPTIPCNNPHSDMRWKKQLSLSNIKKYKYPNISHNTTTELTLNIR